MALQLRPRHRLLHNPSLVQFFSSSNTPDSKTPAPPPPDSDLPPSRPRASSFFSDVKANLRSQEQIQPMRQQVTRHPTSPPQQQQPRRIVPLDEIRKGLSQFPARPTTGEHGHSPSSGPDPSSSSPNMSFTTIFKSLKSNSAFHKPVGEDRLSLSRFSEDLKLKPDSATSTRFQIDRKTNLGPSWFGKELKEEWNVKKDFGESTTTTSGGGMKTELFKTYSYQELGEKLRNLRRPEKKGKDDSGGFSFLEMNERLAKLRDLEEKEISSIVGDGYSSLRRSMGKLGESVEEKARQKTARSITILGQLDGPDSMVPPQEHLVEKYFHPDNMSSAEKLKIELAKVRDEFKMSESDCGSARVQVAQLTTKIKHLSATLHKKDKHSRKGLEGMVQKRKNLLRYLRRKDWDSYCLVLSKLGLRDNPAYKL